MYLQKLTTQNFRLLESVEIAFDPEVTVLIGPNYTGKSSVIDAMLFLRDAALSNFVNSLQLRQGFEKVISWRDQERVLGLTTILGHAADEKFEYRVEFDSLGLRLEQVTFNDSVIWRTANEGPFTLFYGPNNQEIRRVQRDQKLRISLLWELPLVAHELLPLRNHFSSIVNVDPFRNVAFHGAVGPKEMIQATGADLPQVLHYHYNNDREKFDSFEARVQKVLPELDIIETPLVGGSTATVRIRLRANPVKFELASLSSGIKDVLVLLAAAHFSPSGSLVLIEEPENHLHPAAQKALCTVIAELARSEQKQFVLTTHSELILSQFQPEQSIFIDRSGSGSKAIPLAEVEVYSAWQRLGIEKTKLLEVLGRTRQVVVVTEGRPDSKIVEALAKNNGELSAKVLPARAEGGGWPVIIESAAQLRDALKRFHIPSAVFVLLDNDGEREQKMKYLKENGFNDDTSHVWSEKEVESYLLLPSALAAISGKSKTELEKTLDQAKGMGKARLQWVLQQLDIGGTPLDVILTNACRNEIDELPSEFLAVVEKLRQLC